MHEVEEAKEQIIEDISIFDRKEDHTLQESSVPARLPIVIDSEKFSQSIMDSLRKITDLQMKVGLPSFMNPEGEDPGPK